MATEAFAALMGRYIDAFGTAPLHVIGMDDDTLATLMTEALDKGRPIPEEDYDRDLPEGADR